MPNGDQNQAADYHQKFRALPQAVKDYFWDEKNDEKFEHLIEGFKLSDEQDFAFRYLVRHFSVKDIAARDLPSKVEEQLAFSPENARKIVLDILGYHFLPLNEYYDGEIEQVIKELGGKIKNYPEFRLTVKSESAGSAAEEVAREFLPLFNDEVLKHRFLELIESRIRDVRKESDLREILMRSPKVGGLGLDEEMVQKVIEATAKKMRSVKIVSDKEAAPVVSPLKPPSTVIPTQAGIQKKEMDPRSRPSVVALAKEDPGITKAVKPTTYSSELKQSVKIINPPPAPKVASGEILSMETKEEEPKSFPPKVAERPAAPKTEPAPMPPKPVEKLNLLGALKKGGVPMPVKIEAIKPPQRPVSPLASEFVPKKPVVSAPAPKSIEKEVIQKPADVKKETAPPPAVKKISKDISEAELDREIQHIKHDQMTKMPLAPINFLEIATGIVNQSQIILNQEQVGRLKTILTARLKDIRDGQETKDILSRDYALGGMGFSEVQVSAIMSTLEKEFGKISERLRAGVEEKIAADRHIEEERRKKTLETARFMEDDAREKRFAELVGEKPRKVIPAVRQNVQPGTPVIPSPAQTGKPKIQDVKYEPKLVGPVDEIGSLTLTDFRRLGATAKEAALKIKEKIESLKADSIKKWQEGISAWNGGEVNKLYMQLFGEALQKRKSLKDVSAEREAAKEQFLSQDEINAIMELNKSLRF